MVGSTASLRVRQPAATSHQHTPWTMLQAWTRFEADSLADICLELSEYQISNQHLATVRGSSESSRVVSGSTGTTMRHAKPGLRGSS